MVGAETPRLHSPGVGGCESMELRASGCQSGAKRREGAGMKNGTLNENKSHAEGRIMEVKWTRNGLSLSLCLLFLANVSCRQIEFISKLNLTPQVKTRSTQLATRTRGRALGNARLESPMSPTLVVSHCLLLPSRHLVLVVCSLLPGLRLRLQLKLNRAEFNWNEKPRWPTQ